MGISSTGDAGIRHGDGVGRLSQKRVGAQTRFVAADTVLGRIRGVDAEGITRTLAIFRVGPAPISRNRSAADDDGAACDALVCFNSSTTGK
jgi:hypothetical protein